MSTKVYGCSDDLIEFEGELSGEVNYIDSAECDDGNSCLLVFSDGTIAQASYGKGGKGIWSFVLVAKGTMLLGIDICTDDEADPYSDVMRFAPGKLSCVACKEWESVA